MRVLFITPNPVFGGAATATISIASMLIETGIDVVYNDEYDKCQNRGGIEVDHYPYHAMKFSSHKKVRKHICSLKPDFVVWSPQCAIYYYHDIKVLQKSGIKQICIIHSLSLSQDIKGKIIDFLIARVIRKLDATIFVSKYTLTSWEKYSHVRNCAGVKRVIYNAIKEPAMITLEKKEPKRIAFVGRFSQEKNPELFCATSSHYKGKFEFHMWGGGPLLSKCKELYPDIIFHGHENDIERIYQNVDLLVLTSDFENCPMVILEAKVRGIPCVAPRVGGIPEIVDGGKDGVLYDDYRVETIISSINTVMNDYSSYSDCCRERSGGFLYGRVEQSWLNLFKEI